METAVFVARLVGPCYIIIAAGMLINRQVYEKIMDDFSKNATQVFYGGMLALIVGVLILLHHNVWEASWRTVITIFGWGGFIKGIWLIIFPNSVGKFMQAYQKNKTLLTAHALVALILGVFLTVKGYVG